MCPCMGAKYGGYGCLVGCGLYDVHLLCSFRLSCSITFFQLEDMFVDLVLVDPKVWVDRVGGRLMNDQADYTCTKRTTLLD